MLQPLFFYFFNIILKRELLGFLNQMGNLADIVFENIFHAPIFPQVTYNPSVVLVFTSASCSLATSNIIFLNFAVFSVFFSVSLIKTIVSHCLYRGVDVEAFL